MTTSITINGVSKTVSADPDTPVLWVLRNDLQMVGTKFGCGMSLCGACTIYIDGQPSRACITPLSALGSKPLTTIEGLAGPAAEAVRKAWIAGDVAQCGYCQPGQIMAATALLMAHPKPTDEQIEAAMAGNLCRCGTYPRIRAGIREASKMLAQA